MPATPLAALFGSPYDDDPRRYPGPVVPAALAAGWAAPTIGRPEAVLDEVVTEAARPRPPVAFDPYGGARPVPLALPRADRSGLAEPRTRSRTGQRVAGALGALAALFAPGSAAGAFGAGVTRGSAQAVGVMDAEEDEERRAYQIMLARIQDADRQAANLEATAAHRSAEGDYEYRRGLHTKGQEWTLREEDEADDRRYERDKFREQTDATRETFRRAEEARRETQRQDDARDALAQFERDKAARGHAFALAQYQSRLRMMEDRYSSTLPSRSGGRSGSSDDDAGGYAGRTVAEIDEEIGDLRTELATATEPARKQAIRSRIDALQPVRAKARKAGATGTPAARAAPSGGPRPVEGAIQRVRALQNSADPRVRAQATAAAFRFAREYGFTDDEVDRMMDELGID